MRNALRIFGVTVAMAVGIVFARTASATVYYVSGTVQLLVAQDSGFGANSDGFALNGAAPEGACPANTGISPNMLIVVKDDENGSRQYALVMAALASGISLTVRVDDTYKNAGGACYAEFIW